MLVAPPHWQRIDVVSDLHLHAGLPKTFAAWCDYLRHGVAGVQADALVLLGDLFEVWVGDDVLRDRGATADPESRFLQTACQALADAAAQRPVYWMTGNRDFLLSPSTCAQLGMHWLEDPTVLQVGTQRWLLTHGDAWCLADHDYQHFRAQVRSDAWRSAFLAQPLASRWHQARGMRADSETRKRGLAMADWVDLDETTLAEALAETGAEGVIHGHTHRPALHHLPGGQPRWVLSDWDLDGTAPRAEVLRFEHGHWQRHPLV